jgi:hypothetical protein
MKDKFWAWQIREYLANKLLTKFPLPTIYKVIDWVSYAYNNISEETIRKSYRHIGFVIPINDMEDDDLDDMDKGISSVDSTIVSESIMLYKDLDQMQLNK